MTRTISNLHAVPRSAVRYRPIGYFTLVAVLGLALTIAYIYFGFDAEVALGTICAFSFFVFLTENRDRIFGDETSISSSIVVALASIVAFRESAAVFGPVVCASFAGLYLPHLRERAFSKIIINASTIGLSTCAAALCFESLTDARPSAADALVACIPAVVVYWIVNTTLLSGAIALLGRAPFWRSATELLQSETPMLVLATGGAAAGSVFSQEGSVEGFLVLALYLLVIDTCVIAPRAGRWCRQPSPEVTAVTVLTVAALSLGYLTGQAGLVLGLVVVAVVVGVVSVVTAMVRLHARTQRWDWQLAGGVAIVEAPRWMLIGSVGVVAAVAGPWVGLAAFMVVCAALVLGSRFMQRRQRRLAEDDRRVALAVERAVVEGRSIPTAAR